MIDAKSIKAPAEAAIDTATLAVLIRSGAPLVVLDARSGHYDDGRRIPGAKNLPVKSTASEVESVVGSNDAFIITYCSNLHCPASKALYGHLKNLGYENVLEYPDGIAGWVAPGYPVEERAGA